jgi:hypothetical protein
LVNYIVSKLKTAAMENDSQSFKEVLDNYLPLQESLINIFEEEWIQTVNSSKKMVLVEKLLETGFLISLIVVVSLTVFCLALIVRASHESFKLFPLISDAKLAQYLQDLRGYRDLYFGFRNELVPQQSGLRSIILPLEN